MFEEPGAAFPALLFLLISRSAYAIGGLNLTFKVEDGSVGVRKREMRICVLGRVMVLSKVEKLRRVAIGLGLVLALVAVRATNVDADENPQGIETGSVEKDVIVAPVRRVFPKTPSDKELNRLSQTATAKSKPDSKRKKR